MNDPWQLWLATPAAASRFDPQLQSFEDRRRWARMRQDGERQDWQVSRALLAHVGRDSRARSLSHSGAHAALALAPGGTSIGVDIERVDLRRDYLRLARFAFADAEALEIEALPAAERPERFYVLWTLKEACIKALGLTLLDGLKRCRFTLQGERWTADIPTRSAWCASVCRPVPTHYLAVCALVGAQEAAWTELSWPEGAATPWPRLLTLETQS